jgi:Holliday junction resolvase RusA-like endonuclease
MKRRGFSATKSGVYERKGGELRDSVKRHGIMEIQTIAGVVPSKSNSYRVITLHGHGSLCKTEALRKYESSFYIQCAKYRNKLIAGYFELHMAVYYPNRRSDLDGSLKVVLDCLQKSKAIKNDNRCCKIVVEKYLDKANPRIEFKLIEV